MRNRMMKNMGVGIGRVGMSDSISSSSMFGSTLRYYCMRCKTEHKLAACPNCGSKMKKVGS
jgi:rRNA maturation endonuclease Nob1